MVRSMRWRLLAWYAAVLTTVIGGFASLALIPLGLGAIEAGNAIGEIGVGTNRSQFAETGQKPPPARNDA